MHGLKTKIGCIIVALSAIVHLFKQTIGLSMFMVGVAVAIYGLYDRGNRNNSDLRQRIKKPMVRNI